MGESLWQQLCSRRSTFRFSKLVEDIGWELALPDIQKAFRMAEHQGAAPDLFDSMYPGLRLATCSSGETSAGGYKYMGAEGRPSRGAKPPLVVDGQQRLTSYAVMTGTGCDAAEPGFEHIRIAFRSPPDRTFAVADAFTGQGPRGASRHPGVCNSFYPSSSARFVGTARAREVTTTRGESITEAIDTVRDLSTYSFHSAGSCPAPLMRERVAEFFIGINDCCRHTTGTGRLHPSL